MCTPESCADLFATTPSPPSTGEWTILSAIDGNGNIPFGTIDDTSDPEATICALAVGVHTLQWTLYNGPCNPPSSDTMTISVFDATAPDADAGPDQELCAPTSTTTLAGNASVFPGVGTWTIQIGRAHV